MISLIHIFISLADRAFRKKLPVCENFGNPLFSQPSSPPKSLWQEQRSEEHTSELQSRGHLVFRLLLNKNTDDQLFQARNQVASSEALPHVSSEARIRNHAENLSPHLLVQTPPTPLPTPFPTRRSSDLSLADRAFRKKLPVCENFGNPLFSQPSSPPKSLWQEQLVLIHSEIPASKLIHRNRQNSPLKLLPFVYITLYLFNRVYSSLNQFRTLFH